MNFLIAELEILHIIGQGRWLIGDVGETDSYFGNEVAVKINEFWNVQ